MLITTGGQMVRTFVKDIREAGRNTQGVKLINLEAGDKLQAIAPVISEQQEEAAAAEPEAAGQPSGTGILPVRSLKPGSAGVSPAPDARGC